MKVKSSLRHRSDITATIHLFNDAGNLKAYADVAIRSKIGEITLRRFKVISSDSGRLWVALPQFEYQKLFSSAYVDAVVTTKRAFRRIQSVILKEYKKKTYTYQEKSHD